MSFVTERELDPSGAPSSAHPEMHVGPRLALRRFPKTYLEELKRRSEFANPDYAKYASKISAKPWLAETEIAPPTRIVLWQEKDGFLYVPRGLLSEILKRFPTTELATYLSAPQPAEPFRFHGEAWPGQREIVEALLPHNFGTYVAHTAVGKTVVDMMLIAELNLKTLILVHTRSILEQTVEKARKFLRYDAGVVGGGKENWKDITVATVQSLYDKDLSAVKEQFGIVIMDEAHHAPAATFAHVLQQFHAHRVYGQTATLDEKRRRMVEILVGPVVYEAPLEVSVDSGKILIPEFVPVPTPFIPTKEFGPHDLAARMEDLVSDPVRHEFILNHVRATIVGRRALGLSARIEQIDRLASELEGFEPVVYHGDLTKAEQSYALERIREDPNVSLTLATYDIMGEGTDNPVWDQLHLLTPVASEKRTKQAVGRVMRWMEDKQTPRVFDYVDTHDSKLTEWWLTRAKVYEELAGKKLFG